MLPNAQSRADDRTQIEREPAATVGALVWKIAYPPHDLTCQLSDLRVPGILAAVPRSPLPNRTREGHAAARPALSPVEEVWGRTEHHWLVRPVGPMPPDLPLRASPQRPTGPPPVVLALEECKSATLHRLTALGAYGRAARAPYPAPPPTRVSKCVRNATSCDYSE